jgi:hypothetical protein
MAGACALGMLVFVGCGPGVGGTGTGATAFDAFQVSAVSVCEGAIAAELACPQPPVVAGPATTGTQPVRFVDAAGQVTFEVNGNVAVLEVVCQRLRFNGEFGIGAGSAEGFFGSYVVDGSGMNVLAALSAVPVAGGGALTIELRDAEGRVIVEPVLLPRATTVLPAPNPC